ncbi:MAG: hypothetical protein ACKVPX_10780 [Myxococcaceae bacterium]
MSTRVPLFCLALVALLTGCRDLALPSGEAENPGPTVRFVSPVSLTDGGIPEIGLTGFVSLVADDADGVSEVSLSCDVGGGSSLLLQWTSPPYQSLVNFTPCRGPGDSSTTLTLTLRATGRDALQNVSEQVRTVQVRVNAEVATLAMDAPARVAPGRAFDLTVTSDRPLQGPPVVLLEGTPATLLGQVADGGQPAYTYRSGTAPQLGADRWDGGLPVPFAVLAEVERPMSVLVEARALSGNLSQLAGQVLVSRELWQRPLPAVQELQPGSGNAWMPTVANGGLQIPMQLQRSTGWEPAFFGAGDGNISLLTGTFDTLNARGLTPSGHWALSNSGGVAPIGSQVNAAPSGTLLRQQTGGTAVLRTTNRPMFKAGKYACEESLSYTVCPASATRYLACIAHDGEISVPAGTAAFLNSNPPDVATSAHAAALWLGDFCSTPGLDNYIVVLNTNGTGSFRFMPTDIAVDWINRLLPLGDGSFFSVYSDVGATYQPYVLRFDVNTTAYGTRRPLPTWTGMNQMTAAEVLLARQDGVLLGYRTTPPFTRFGLWSHTTGALLRETEIASSFNLGVTTRRVPEQQYALDENQNAYLLMRRFGISSGIRVAVISLDSQANPRWVYQYQRNDPGTSGDEAFRLVYDAASGQVYLTDAVNGFVIALAK